MLIGDFNESDMKKKELDLIKKELNEGNKFIGDFAEVNCVINYIENINIPYNFTHAQSIELFKIKDDYICVKSEIFRKED